MSKQILWQGYRSAYETQVRPYDAEAANKSFRW